MGEVWKAKDARLNRMVAVKVLPEEMNSSSEALARFQREAKAVAALNHPNILSLFDVGEQEGRVYAVMELLEGATLRQRMGGGTVPYRKAIAWGVQIASGLAAAHGKGVVHRDLKPENLWTTADDHIKILDFGLAKQAPRSSATGDRSTVALGLKNRTEEGTVLGTLGYMSPEQVRGEDVDARSDIFSFGAVLHELLSGTRAFVRDTPADSLAAVLKEEPADLNDPAWAIPPALQRVVSRCLEKDPALRFQDARDLVFALEQCDGRTSGTIEQPSLPRSNRRAWLAWAGGLAALGAAGSAGFLADLRFGDRAIRYRRLSFRRGILERAYFLPGSSEAVCSFFWDRGPWKTYRVRLDDPTAGTELVSEGRLSGATRSGHTFTLEIGDDIYFQTPGTLMERAPGTGAARPRVENVLSAATSPDGKTLLLAFSDGGGWRMEFPEGHAVFRLPTGYVDYRMAVSPTGMRAAFVTGPSSAGPYSLVVAELGRPARVVSEGWRTLSGVAWHHSEKEVWVTGNRREAYLRKFHAVGLDGRVRSLDEPPGVYSILDIDSHGRVLAGRYEVDGYLQVQRRGSAAHHAGWLDGSSLADLSPDGRRLLFSETRAGGGDANAVYLRDLQKDGPPVRLGEGRALALSEDGRTALVRTLRTGALSLVPTGAGLPRAVDPADCRAQEARFWPGSQDLLLFGARPSEAPRSYRWRQNDARLQPIAPPGWQVREVDPESGRFLGLDPQGTWRVWTEADPDRGKALMLPKGGLFRPFQFAPKGMVFLLHPTNLQSGEIWTIDPESGKSEVWMHVGTPQGQYSDLMGARLSRDGEVCASFLRTIQADLFLVEGLR